MNMKHIGLAVAIGAIGFFGYGAYHSGTEVFKHPISYMDSFDFKDPEAGQSAPEYMMSTLIQNAHDIKSSGGSAKDVDAMQKALFMKMDRTFSKASPEKATEPIAKGDGRTFVQKWIKRIPTYDQAKAMTEYEYDSAKGYIQDGVHIVGANKPRS